MLPLAAHTAGNPHAGWWAGLIIGFSVVVVVVLVVAFILAFASRIGDRTQDALEAFDAARDGTSPLARFGETRAAAEDLLAAMRAVRDVLPRGRA